LITIDLANDVLYQYISLIRDLISYDIKTVIYLLGNEIISDIHTSFFCIFMDYMSDNEE